MEVCPSFLFICAKAETAEVRVGAIFGDPRESPALRLLSSDCFWPWGRLSAESDVSGGVLRYVHDLATKWGVDDYVPLRTDRPACFRIKNQVTSNTLFGAARNSLGKVRSTCLGVVQFDRKFRIQLRGKHRGCRDDKILGLRTDHASIFLPIIAGAPFREPNFVRRWVIRVDGKVAVIGFGRIGNTACRKQSQKPGKEH